MLIAVTVVMVIADWRFGLLAPGRALLADISFPVFWTANLPVRVARWVDEIFSSRGALIAENDALRSEALILRGRAQKLATLTAENIRLRELLNSTALPEENVLVAEIVGVSPDINNQVVVIDKGARQNLNVGQAVIDAYGLFGQIIEVDRYSSRVLLITDATHALPVEVVRNGVRLIAEGTGRINQLDVKYVAATMDVRPGDLLVSSNLGQRFPGGYPVAQIESVTNDPGLPFAIVSARPSAQLDRSRHVLVVLVKQKTGESRETSH